MDNYLFSSSDWYSTKDRTLSELSDAIDSIDEDRLLSTPTDALCGLFLEKHRIDVPVLDEDSITVAQHEVPVDVRRNPGRYSRNWPGPLYANETIIEVDVPFSGDAKMFYVRPSTYTSSPPRADVRGERAALTIQVAGVNLDKDRVKGHIDKTITSIKEYLARQRNDVLAFDTELRSAIESSIESRQKKLLHNHDLLSSLGYRLRERKDATRTFPAPEVRRRVTPVMPTAGIEPLTPVPTLLDAEFEHIIAVIEKMSIVMERSPGAFSTMNEEALRSHILVQLNGHYEGGATGETFNYEGKTDILIRHKGKNIFIAECKFWQGPKSLANAIDQLLGYASWRDTKIAIVLFSRQKNFTSVLTAIPDVVTKHPSYKRAVQGASVSEFRYVLGHRDDPSRELTLAVVAFDVPSKI